MSLSTHIYSLQHWNVELSKKQAPIFHCLLLNYLGTTDRRQRLLSINNIPTFTVSNLTQETQ
jgi:hypothetical protein